MRASILILASLGLSMGAPMAAAPPTATANLPSELGDASAKKRTVVIDLDYDSIIINLQVGEDGVPCNVEVTGDILEPDGSLRGALMAGFFQCPVITPLPESLGDNIYGIPAGTEMPAWDGTVVMMINGEGILTATERAFIFPTDPSDPTSPLAVLSTATVTGGTDTYTKARGEILTTDGFDGLGSLIGTLTLK